MDNWQTNDLNYFNLLNNYVYIYHLGEDGEFAVLPSWPESITDSQSPNWSSSQPLARSAPLQSYSGSGPRQMSFTFQLHRDAFSVVNKDVSNLRVDKIAEDDYVDTVIKRLQACAVPKYTDALKMINPPMAAVKLGNDIFIKGIVTSVSTTYQKPIMKDGKYAIANVTFAITEVDPYDAKTVEKNGSFRGITRTLKNGIYK